MKKENEKSFKESFVNKKDMTEFATIFSEGDNLLKETLLNLWNNNIMTFSCCKGHETEKYYIPAYLSIVIDEYSIDLIKNLYSKLYSEKKDINFVIGNINKNKFDAFTIYMRNNTKEYILNLINQYVGIESNENNKVIENSLYMLKYAKEKNLKYEFEITKNNIFIQFRTQTYDDNYIDYKPLDECIISLSNIETASHLFIECNEDELDIIMDILRGKNKVMR